MGIVAERHLDRGEDRDEMQGRFSRNRAGRRTKGSFLQKYDAAQVLRRRYGPSSWDGQARVDFLNYGPDW